MLGSLAGVLSILGKSKASRSGLSFLQVSLVAAASRLFDVPCAHIHDTSRGYKVLRPYAGETVEKWSQNGKQWRKMPNDCANKNDNVK